MAFVYLIRHGQAGFGTQHYDALSPLGHQQSGVVGRAGGKIDGAQGRGSWAARGIGRACRPLQTARARGRP